VSLFAPRNQLGKHLRAPSNLIAEEVDLHDATFDSNDNVASDGPTLWRGQLARGLF